MPNRRELIRALPLFGGAMLVSAPAWADASGGGNFRLATATPGGTYYAVGVAISTLIKLKLEESNGITLTAIASAGSAANIDLLDDQEVDFAILQGLFG